MDINLRWQGHPLSIMPLVVKCSVYLCICIMCARHYYYCTSEINFSFLSVNGQDFTSPAMPTVVFNTGADNGDTVCTSITIIDDDDFEGDHSFTADIDAITPSTIDIMLSTTAAEIVIQDDEGEINFCDAQNIYSITGRVKRPHLRVWVSSARILCAYNPLYVVVLVTMC